MQTKKVFLLGKVILAAAIALVSGSGFAQSLPSKSEVIETMVLVNDHWILNNGLGDADWDPAVYYTGNMSFYQLYPDDYYLDRALQWANSRSWNLEGNRHNKLCAGQTYINLYSIQPIESRIASTRSEINYQIDYEEDDLWFAVDANYMAMPTFAWMAKLDGDDPVMYEMMWALHHHNKDVRGGTGLYDDVAHLWYRDDEFIYPLEKSPNGAKVFWSRGNGWIFGALVRVLQTLPEGNSHQDEYIQNFQDMAAALKEVQQPSGFWHVNLDDPIHVVSINSSWRDGPETSGTAFFTYGIAWGIYNGYLDKNTYLPVVADAWNAMVANSVHSNGRLGYVQGIGLRPESSQPIGDNSTADFGVGAFLLAGTEVAKLAEGNMPSAPEPSENLALNTVIDFSEEQSSNPASNLTDGNINNRWSAQGFPQWVELDLGSVKSINRIHLFPYQYRAYKYKIEIKSAAGESYTTVVDRTKNTDWGGAITNIFSTTDARFVRLSVVGAHDYDGEWVSINELKIFKTDVFEGYQFEAESMSYLSSAVTKVVSDSEASSGEFVLFKENSIGDWVEFALPGIQAGTYTFRYTYRQHNQRGTAQTWTGGSDLGTPIDQYGTTQYKEVEVGERTFISTGNKKIRFTITGKHSSSDLYKISIDKVTLERQ
jgi:rhamnogalacturonyl hydrolase YesR